MHVVVKTRSWINWVSNVRYFCCLDIYINIYLHSDYDQDPFYLPIEVIEKLQLQLYFCFVNLESS